MNQQIKRNENGFSQVIILIAIVIIAAIGFVGYRVMNKSSAPAVLSTPAGSAANSACLKVYNDKDFCKFAASFTLTGVPYKAVFTSSQGTAGSSTSMTILTDSKGNTSLTSTSVGTEMAYITLDGTTYMKDTTDNTWWKFAAGNASTPATTDPANEIKFDTTTTGTPTTTYKKIGTEACGSATCFKYQVADASTAGTTQYVWINTKTYQMQRWSSTDSTNGTTDAVFTYQPVTITAPTPVKDFATTSAADAAALQQALQAAGQ